MRADHLGSEVLANGVVYGNAERQGAVLGARKFQPIFKTKIWRCSP
jgi:hypothetical protein